MMLSETVKRVGLTPLAQDAVDREINGAYCSDLLDDVLKNAKPADIWITNQNHENCIAVASLLDLSAIVLAGGIEPDEETVQKAAAEWVSLFTTDLPAFEVAGRLYELGVRAL